MSDMVKVYFKADFKTAKDLYQQALDFYGDTIVNIADNDHTVLVTYRPKQSIN